MAIEPLICEFSVPGRQGVRFPAPDVPMAKLPDSLVRENLEFPEISEVDVVRHFTRLSQKNYAVDTGFYPLGSCTMKYNPRVNEDVARFAGFAHAHPLQPIETVQGNLALMYALQQVLGEIGGFTGVSLQPAAGAHGELTGVLIMRAYHHAHHDDKRDKILIPDSAHGTNPATSSMAGMRVIEIPSDKRGNINLEALKTECDDTLVGLMITNPNTLGLFEENILKITKLVHESGGLVYGDGANMNALLGIARPGDLGIDVLHFNLHKTFSTPHGGGGPGSGPVGVVEKLVDFLPGPIVDIIGTVESEDPDEDDGAPLFGFVVPPKSIGRVKSFYGHFGIFVRAYAYIRMLGSDGLRKVAEYAVLNANYLRVRLQGTYLVPYDRICQHEFVAQGHWDDIPDIHALDIAKRLIDFGFHPPTNYFPMIVPEALMIEPTETESKETLDAFVDALLRIAEEARTSPEMLKSAPHNSPVGRVDDVKAAKDLILGCPMGGKEVR